MAIDGKAIVYIFDSSTTTLVKPNCKKIKNANDSTTSDKNNFSEKSSSSSVSIGCITPSDIKTLSWQQIIQESIFSPFDYPTLGNGVIYKNSNYPPPRFSI
ncbi:hypothetical protein [Confluentibacter flavum]|uniref:Uncharacterized protein n=1 Tax=Confluentibacter flavum TaxID=1909700 RepID=A0A2N3HPD6_9FLAO|nr:hypothetical protein [Confluentibacter flavum]PKQ46781.1 hypothetical protein CSW08_01060 [Confluentibacter flavum]